jgi:pimeloyl-ACP methyl ester carboxylesterase
VARRIDFVSRADEIAKRKDQPAVLLVVGEDDDIQGFREPAAELRAALADRYTDPDRVEMVLVPGMEHTLAEEPGVEPAPQTAHAAEVDRLAMQWLRRYLH